MCPSELRNAANYNLHRRYVGLNKGDLVIVRVPSRKGKLSLQYIGPCEVLAAESDLVYRVKHNKSGRAMRVHLDRLRRYTPLVALGDDDRRAADALAAPSSTPTLVGRRVNKHFGAHGWHHGTITDVDDDFAHVRFDDGDQEDLTLEEVQRVLLPAAADAPPPGAPEQHVEEGDMAILRHRASNIIYVGKVVATFPDTGEFNFHFYCHQNVGTGHYDAYLPLGQRRVQPEYYYTNKGGVRHFGTTRPKPAHKPHVFLLDLDEYELLANKFTVLDDGAIPADVLRALPSAHAASMNSSKKRRTA